MFGMGRTIMRRSEFRTVPGRRALGFFISSEKAGVIVAQVKLLPAQWPDACVNSECVVGPCVACLRPLLVPARSRVPQVVSR